MGCVMPFLNIIGPVVIKLRQARKWSQEVLAARLQCQQADISRDVLANIESGRTQVTDKHIRALHKAFALEEPEPLLAGEAEAEGSGGASKTGA